MQSNRSTTCIVRIGSSSNNFCIHFQEIKMSKILISDLFAETDSFLTELSDNELQVSGGGKSSCGSGSGSKNKKTKKSKKSGSKKSKKSGSGYGCGCW
jgi:hypothetical protein